MVVLNNCRTAEINAVAYLIEGVDDNIVKSGNHRSTEPLFQYLSTLNDEEFLVFTYQMVNSTSKQIKYLPEIRIGKKKNLRTMS